MAGEAEQWREWFERHAAALILFARQWSANASEAEDAVQSGFLRFWRTRWRARDEVAYIYACVRSAAMDLGRSRRRRVAREMAAAENESAFESPADQIERGAAIEAALAELPADQREVVVMRIWGELTFAQIAEALDVPLATASTRYRTALRRLEMILSKEVGHE